MSKIHPPTPEAIKQEGERALSAALAKAHIEGYIEAVEDFGVWRDGKQWIGVHQREVRSIRAELMKEWREKYANSGAGEGSGVGTGAKPTA